jgi:hypothetical protein
LNHLNLRPCVSRSPSPSPSDPHFTYRNRQDPKVLAVLIV